MTSLSERLLEDGVASDDRVEVVPSAQGLGEDPKALGTSPTDYADAFHLALKFEDMGRPRTQQTDGGVLGASDAGQCERKAVWTVTQQPATDVPKKGRAQAGTYLHAGTLAAVEALFPHKLIENSLTVTLPSGVQIPLHPDEIDPQEPSVTDYKFTDSINVARRSGPTDAQHMQRNLQYLAAHQAGLVPPVGIVRNLFVNVADMDDTFVQQEPFSMEWIHRADDWYQRVIYAVQNLEDGERTWPANMCKDFCPFVSRCRPPDFELDQQITSPELQELVLLAFEQREARKAHKTVEDDAVKMLRGVSGLVGDVQVRSTVVNADPPYTKVELKRVKS